MGAITATDAACLGWADVLDACVRLVESGAGLTASPYIIDHTGNTPSHLIDSTFSVEFQTDNTGKYRGGDADRMGHLLSITHVKKLATKGQYTSQAEAIRTSETITRVLGVQADTAELRVTFLDDVRSLTFDRAYLVSRLTFRLEHDWYAQPLDAST